MIRFVFDVDGVILDFESSYVRVLREMYQLAIPENYQAECWYFSDILTEEQVWEGWRYFIGSEHFQQLTPLVEAQALQNALGAYPVHFVTNIPHEYLTARQSNLEQAGFRFDSLHCGGFLSFDQKPPVTKAEVIRSLLQNEETLFFVDDHPDNCLNVLEYFPQAQVWLMSRPFNQKFEHPAIRRAREWKEMLGAIEEWRSTMETRPRDN